MKRSGDEYRHQALSSDGYLKFIEDDFLAGSRVNPEPDKQSESQPDVL